MSTEETRKTLLSLAKYLVVARSTGAKGPLISARKLLLESWPNIMSPKLAREEPEAETWVQDAINLVSATTIQLFREPDSLNDVQWDSFLSCTLQALSNAIDQ